MLIIKLCNTWLTLNGIARGKRLTQPLCIPTREIQVSFLHFHFKLPESRSNYHSVTITLTCVYHKNTIQGATNQCSSYVTPLYYITKWYLRSILSQISCPKIVSSIAYSYDFIEINLGQHNLTKLANNKATKKLNHPQCVMSSSSPHPIRSFEFTTNNGDNLLPTQSQA